MIVAGTSMDDFEKRIVKAFGIDYFNGVRWGATCSATVFFGVSMQSFVTMKQHFVASCITHGMTETAARKKATLFRSMRFAVTGCKLPFIVGVGSCIAGAHNTLSALLSNLRVRELQIDVEGANDPSFILQTDKPTFWDGVMVGVLGSAMDADTPQQPVYKYLNMRAGY